MLPSPVIFDVAVKCQTTPGTYGEPPRFRQRSRLARVPMQFVFDSDT